MYKTPNSNTNIWWSEGVGPQFNENTPVFTCKSNANVSVIKTSRLSVSEVSMTRLLRRPSYRTVRKKFDPNLQEC